MRETGIPAAVRCAGRGAAPRRLAVMVAMLAGLAFLPVSAWAQSALSGAIAGVVKDVSGGVLPGVTVEASSPALIEKARAVVTDTQGNYKITDLRPGTYTVTFTLAGFSTFKREGIELTTGFTAAANAELKVGTLEETVTVTGASPVVDVQNVRQQTVLSRDVLSTVPTGKTIQAYASLIVAAQLPASAQDVGGNQGESPTSFAVHGGRQGDLKLQMDGMGYNYMSGSGGGGGRNFVVNQVSVQEVSLQTDGNSAEVETGGVQMNVVPREGGNTYKVYGVTTFANGNMQNDNINDGLIARGLAASTPIKKIWDNGIGLGGPFLHDKLWFFVGARSWGAATTRGGFGSYANATQDSLFYTPDLGKPGYTDRNNKDSNARLTWQVAPKFKVNGAFYYQIVRNAFANWASGAAPESSTMTSWVPNNIFQTSYTYPVSSRLLFEGAASHYTVNSNQDPAPGVNDHVSITELSNGLTYGSRNVLGSSGYGLKASRINTYRASGSYVTGSHGLKFGLQAQTGLLDQAPYINQSMSYRFLNGVPQGITVYAMPYRNLQKVAPLMGLYAQDQWTIRRLTLSIGGRLDYVKAFVPDIHLPAGPFVPARDFSRIDDLPNWKDFEPRLGGAYDLFGTGKTALKVSLGRFVAGEAGSVAEANNPLNKVVNSATRTWADANRDFIPQESELGPLSSSNFGKAIVTERWADDLLVGHGKREFNWQNSVSVQHEIRPGVGLNAGYFRRWYGNFRVTDNLLVGPADYSQFCVTAPQDTRLPGGGGQQICGLYDLNPGKFGQVSNLVVLAKNFGKQTEVYNGIDVGVNARFGKSGYLAGGMSTGRTVTDNCALTVDSPQKRFCKVTMPFSAQTQVKFSGVYPLPWDLQASGTYQNLPGIPILASYVATNAQVAPSLGRNLGACGAAATCASTVIVDNLFEPNTMFEDRINQVDVRLTRSFRAAGLRVQGMVDVYNVFNAASVLATNTRYGASWLQVTQILGGRLFKVGMQFDF